MRWCVAVVLLLVCVGAEAADVLLIPENNPAPIYPQALSRAGVMGDVRIMFTASADGSVSRVRVVEADHPELAQAARAAVTQWRFRPWTVEEGKPAEQEVMAPMVFRLDLDLPIHINRTLKTLKCRTLNENLARVSEHSWIDSRVFHDTRAYLSNVIHKTQLRDEQRLAMIARLNRQVPAIVMGCRFSPMRRYMSLLPEDIRQLL